MKILDIKGREILDSRGNPTVEVDVLFDDNKKVTASVPSGASTGVHEALELRDGDDNRYSGKGVLKAVSNINGVIRDSLIGLEFDNIYDIDKIMLKLDGTENKSKLGANAILGVSLGCFKALSVASGKELYAYIGDGRKLPLCMMNILNGGAHAANKLDIQEFMIVPQRDNYLDNLRMGAEVFHSLQTILKNEGKLTGVGDEGGFAPMLDKAKDALDLIVRAVEKSGYILGSDIKFALDVAASEFYDDGYYKLEGKTLTKEEMVSYLEDLVNSYPIMSIEDGVAQDDYEGWKLLTDRLGDKIMLVGDDLFVTNKKLLQKGIDEGYANAILLKVNQIGTVSETLETIKLAKEYGYKTIISHRSGETEDTYIADMAVGLSLGYIKTGSLSRTDRLCKYNRLIRIDEGIRVGD